ncbi:DUF6325 family protein [Nocardioides panaciterrulae]|uniref:DUF1269 domain-containing protein n=1 Tax=Nocardioides panaciterrulae TaxID=661492 RepID=A0A7Y9JAA3_9ACTN|nr:hypothetical protein [Nocardioides panaciterrulae]
MTATETEIHGPVDFALLEFPRDRLTGEAAQALMDLVDAGTIRLYDLVVLAKDDDGGVEVLELTDPAGPAAGFSYFAGARSGLLGDDDVAEAAGAMDSGTVAALLIYENTWAAPFVAAARRSGGELIASARIPATDVIAAVNALDASA